MGPSYNQAHRMKPSIWLAGFLFGASLGSPSVRGGTVLFLDNRTALEGKLTLSASSIHVEGKSPSDVKLADVLEADFSDNDFHLNYFSSDETPDKLPTDFQGHDIGPVEKPGSFAYEKGELTLTSSGPDIFGPVDKCYFLATPWQMREGQWTLHVKDRPDPVTTVGIMLRTGFGPGATGFNYGLTRDNGFMTARRVPDSEPGRDTRFQHPGASGWIRLTRYFNYLMMMETSVDGKIWEMSAGNGDMRQPSGDIFGPTTLAGLFVTGVSGALPGSVTLDHVTFAPSAAEPEMVRPGVLLRSGTYLAGGFGVLDAKSGVFSRGNVNFPITADQVSAVLWQPTSLRQIAEVSDQTGVIMKNGDYMASDLQKIDGTGAQMTSVVLGPMDFIYTFAMRACILHKYQLKPVAYEIRLQDGSDIRATSLELSDKQLVVHEASGVTVPISPDEVAQFRAGSSRAEPLIEGNDTSISNWQGPNQEHIIAATPGTPIDLPVGGPVASVAMRVVFLSEQPDAQVVIRVLNNGKEIGRAGPIKATDQPRSLVISLSDAPKKIRVIGDSSNQGAKILLLDPGGIKK
jgi:hypothetical protein